MGGGGSNFLLEKRGVNSQKYHAIKGATQSEGGGGENISGKGDSTTGGGGKTISGTKLTRKGNCPCEKKEFQGSHSWGGDPGEGKAETTTTRKGRKEIDQNKKKTRSCFGKGGPGRKGTF